MIPQAVPLQVELPLVGTAHGVHEVVPQVEGLLVITQPDEHMCFPDPHPDMLPELPPVLTPPVLTPPVLTPPVLTPPVLTPPVPVPFAPAVPPVATVMPPLPAGIAP